MLVLSLLLAGCASDVGVTQIPEEVAEPTARLTVQPTELAFEAARHGDVLTFDITNTGDGRMVVEDLDVLLSGTLFAVSDPAMRVLDSGQSTTVEVSWLGDPTTDASGLITVVTDAPDGVVDVLVAAIGVERRCDPAGNPFGAGQGTAEDPFLLCASDHLARIPTGTQAHFELAEDLDLIGYSRSPIEDFDGVFDGAGHTLRNWTQTAPGSLSLFETVSGTVMDLRVVSPTLTFGRDSGTVARTVTGMLDGVHVSDAVLVSSGGMMGGVVNMATQGSLLSDVSFDGTITTTSDTGFLGGVVHSCRGLCTQLSASGVIDGGDAWKVGGLTVHVVGTLSSSVSRMEVSGGSRVGGLAAVLSGTIEDSYAEGSVSGLHWVGGLVGESYGGTEPTLIRSYSAGVVTSTTSHANVGGAGLLAWNNNPTTFIASVWDVDATGQTWSAGGTGLTSAELRDPSHTVFTTWSAPWVHAVGEAPRLGWETAESP